MKAEALSSSSPVIIMSPTQMKMLMDMDAKISGRREGRSKTGKQ